MIYARLLPSFLGTPLEDGRFPFPLQISSHFDDLYDTTGDCRNGNTNGLNGSKQ